MSDQRERELQRRAAVGDEDAAARAQAARCRRGEHLWPEAFPYDPSGDDYVRFSTEDHLWRNPDAERWRRERYVEREGLARLRLRLVAPARGTGRTTFLPALTVVEDRRRWATCACGAEVLRSQSLLTRGAEPSDAALLVQLAELNPPEPWPWEPVSGAP